MMPHSLGGQGHAGHEAKRVNEILALEGAVQLAILNAPTLECGELRRDLLLGQLLDTHGEPPQFICSASVPRAVFPFGWGVQPNYPAGYRNQNIVGLRGAAGKSRLRLCVGRGIWLKEVVLSFMVFARIDPVRVPMPSGRPWSSS